MGGHTLSSESEANAAPTYPPRICDVIHHKLKSDGPESIFPSASQTDAVLISLDNPWLVAFDARLAPWVFTPISGLELGLARSRETQDVERIFTYKESKRIDWLSPRTVAAADIKDFLPTDKESLLRNIWRCFFALLERSSILEVYYLPPKARAVLSGFDPMPLAWSMHNPGGLTWRLWNA
ncbi:hypothetical protein MAPG_00163 [Magnaporthiopsis poae ATCC 64411]|uniref:Uncharacterized protein n=1 Tax=Magnaporthiopsis poae (strain ATCC 64411 / 73-15) TaxID=644358 RepID=A0A0C4DK99_MAGP6|nr:hypothetical protein MAPG_00163 [Magnaporthiopsis poae ATCC 64411]